MSRRKEEQPPEGMNPETADVWPPRGPDLPEQAQPSPPPLPPTGVPPDVAAEQREEAAKEPPRRDEHGQLTHYGAHKVFDERGSVILADGRHVTERDKLPPEEEFAAQNDAAAEALEADIDRRMAALEQQRARLHGRRAKGKKE